MDKIKSNNKNNQNTFIKGIIYADVRKHIIKGSIIIAIVASILAIIVNFILAFSYLSIIVHIIPIIMLPPLFFKLPSKVYSFLGVFVPCYYCFIYTPITWFLFPGIQGNMPYVIFMFLLLIIVLYDNLLQFFFTISFLIITAILLLYDCIIYRFPEIDSIIIIDNSISFYVSLMCLIFFLSLFKQKYIKMASYIEELSIRDSLTSIYNMRYIDTIINQWELEYINKQEDYYLAIIDVNEFKPINDNYGHIYGDKVLIELVQIMTTSFPDTFICGRYGGDEFVIISKNACYEDFVQLCENFQEKITNVLFTDKTLSLSVSVGFNRRNLVNSRENLFISADTLMYEEKKQLKL